MNTSRARFTLRYIFTHCDFIATIIYQSDHAVVVQLTNGVRMDLSSAAAALGAETPLVVQHLRMIAPQSRLISESVDFPIETTSDEYPQASVA